MLRWGILPILFVLWAASSGPATAVLFTVSAGDCHLSGSNPVGCQGTQVTQFPEPFPGTSFSFAHAGPGDLGAEGRATLSTNNVAIAGSGTFVRVGGGAAEARYDDFIVTGPATSDGLVATTFNIALDGFFRPMAAAVGSTSIGAEASALARLDIIAISHTVVPFGTVLSNDADGLIICEEAGGCDIESFLGSDFGEIGASIGAGVLAAAGPGSTRGLFSSGIFSGASIAGGATSEVAGGTIINGFSGLVDEVFQSSEFMLPIGQAFELIFLFQTVAGVDIKSSGSGQGIANSFIDFSRSLEFPSDGPVLNLPVGYTLSSLGAQIVDNRWIASNPSTSIPEPGSLLLYGLGLIGLTVLRVQALGIGGRKRAAEEPDL